MIFSWYHWLRLAMAGTLALCGIAVLVGRSYRPLPERRICGYPSFVYVNPHVVAHGDERIHRIDPEAGVLEPVRVPGGEALEHAAGSPWRDARGHWRVVGRGLSRSGVGQNPAARDLYLALYEFPGGSLLDRVETELLPVGAPCWEPGTSARVVYAGGDGVLYGYDFDGPENRHRNRREPQEISWRCEPPGLGPVQVAEPSWPADSRLGRRLFVRLTSLERIHGRLAYTSCQLWWFRLDTSGTAIVAASPLVRPDPAIPGASQWGDHFPTLLSGPGGELVVAYLTFRPSKPRGELRISRLRIDPASGDPVVAERGTAVAGDCHWTPPVPSADGRRLCCVVQPAGSRPRLFRVDVAGLAFE